MEYNKDTTIEVGDLVRTVLEDGPDFIIREENGGWFSPDGREWFAPTELEIMTPKAELESVYAEEKRLEEKKDKCYEILKDCYNKGDWDLFEMATEIEAIFNQD